MLQKQGWVKDPFKIQDTPMDLYVTEDEMSIDRVLDFKLKLNFNSVPSDH
jgi:hypothetical protein